MTEPTAPEITQDQDPEPESSELPEKVEPIQLPADHPLVKTLAAQKEAMRELKSKAQRLDAIEEANKTEAEKLLARAEAAETIAAEATLNALRSEASASKGVPAALLSGNTQEELEASADALLLFKGTAPVAPPSTAQGNVGTPVGGTVSDLDEQIDAATKAGDHALAITLKRQKAATTN